MIKTVTFFGTPCMLLQNFIFSVVDTLSVEKRHVGFQHCLTFPSIPLFVGTLQYHFLILNSPELVVRYDEATIGQGKSG